MPFLPFSGDGKLGDSMMALSEYKLAMPFRLCWFNAINSWFTSALSALEEKLQEETNSANIKGHRMVTFFMQGYLI